MMKICQFCVIMAIFVINGTFSKNDINSIFGPAGSKRWPQLFNEGDSAKSYCYKVAQDDETHLMTKAWFILIKKYFDMLSPGLSRSNLFPNL